MIRLIIFLIVGYFVFKIFRSLLIPKRQEDKVKGAKTEPAQKRNIDRNKIEDVDYEEIE